MTAFERSRVRSLSGDLLPRTICYAPRPLDQLEGVSNAYLVIYAGVIIIAEPVGRILLECLPLVNKTNYQGIDSSVVVHSSKHRHNIKFR